MLRYAPEPWCIVPFLTWFCFRTAFGYRLRKMLGAVGNTACAPMLNVFSVRSPMMLMFLSMYGPQRAFYSETKAHSYGDGLPVIRGRAPLSSSGSRYGASRLAHRIRNATHCQTNQSFSFFSLLFLFVSFCLPLGCMCKRIYVYLGSKTTSAFSLVVSLSNRLTHDSMARGASVARAQLFYEPEFHWSPEHLVVQWRCGVSAASTQLRA